MTTQEPQAVPYAHEYDSDFVDVNGLRLHYTSWNPDGERTVVMLHGLNVQLHTWDPIAHMLSDSYRVLCLDLRGHGQSDWSRDGYWTTDFVADLHGFVRAVDAVPFALVGHSLGARIAIAYAGEHTEDLTHLLLSDTGPETPKDTAKNVGSMIASTNDIRGFRNDEEALEHYRQAHPEWKPVFHDLHATFQVRRNWAGKLVLRSDPDMYWIMRGAGLKDVPYLWEMASRADVPTLIMHGVRSPFFNEEILQRMTEKMPQASVATVDSGHYIPREVPDAFVQHVRDFIER